MLAVLTFAYISCHYLYPVFQQATFQGINIFGKSFGVMQVILVIAIHTNFVSLAIPGTRVKPKFYIRKACTLINH